MKLFLYISILLLFVSTLFAEELYDYKILESKDTLKITRTEKPFQISGQIGYSLERNSGAIQYTLFPDDHLNTGDNIYQYNPKLGYGIGFDIMAEHKVFDFLAFGLKFSPMIFRSVEYHFEEKVSGLQFDNTLSNDSYYFGIEPQIIAIIQEFDMDFLIGPRYELNYKSGSTFSNSFTNTSNIRVARSVDFAPSKQLWGFSIEIRKRILIAISGSNNRINVSPFLKYSHSPNFFETFGTASANNSIKVGIAVYLGFDEISYDTLIYKDNEELERIEPIKANKDLIATEIKGIHTQEVKEIDVKIYEPGFAEPYPVDKYSLDEETIDYLNDILHIMKSNDDTVIEIMIIQPDQDDKNNDSRKKAEAMISYILKKGAKSNQVIKKTKVDESIMKSRIEINILNN